MEQNIIYSLEPFKDILNILNKDYMYKNILFLGEIDDNLKNYFDAYRSQFCFVFDNDIDSDNIQKYDLIIIRNTYYLNHIETNTQYNGDFILCGKDYIPYEDMSYLLRNNKVFKIIIDENSCKMQLSTMYCKYLIDTMYHYVSEFDDRLRKLFYDTNYQYEDIKVDINAICNFSTFDYKNVDLISKNTFMENVSGSKSNDYAFKLLFPQVLLNIYKNFIKNATPFNVDIEENYNFDTDKFWFVIKHFKNKVLSNIIDLEYFILSVKSRLIETNIDYYYKICNEYKNFNIKKDLYEIGKSYNKNCFFKIIYQMGLIKYGV